MCADRNTNINGRQIKDGSLTKVEVGAQGEVAGNILTVQNDGTVDWDSNLTTIGFILDGGGQTIITGVAGDIEVPFKCEIQQITLLADQSGSIQVDILKDTYANYPPASSITAASIPAIVSGTKYQDIVLSGWTKTINAGDILRFNVDSVSVIQRCLVSLKVVKTL